MMGIGSYISRTLHLTANIDTCYADHDGVNSTLCVSQDDIEELKEYSSLAGSVKETVSRFLLTPERLVQIWVALSAVVVWEELLLFFALGFLMPLALNRNDTATSPSTSTTKKDGTQKAATNPSTADPSSSLGHIVATNIAQVAKLSFAVYIVDIIKVILQGVGFDFSEGDLPHAFANILYMAWMLNRISAFKRFLLAKQTKNDPQNLSGQVQLVDRMVDAFLYCIGLYAAVDSVQDDMGAAAKGFVALGSVGTMVIGLASQGLAAQLFNGLFLASSNRIAVGDFVKFDNGVSGTVIKLGWMETMIRAPDETMMTVPNKDLADQRVSNMSRVQQSAVKQTLRFKYKDIDKLPAVLESIKDEVKEACPDVIVDGTRPFRAFLTGYHADHIAAQIDFRFRLKPLSDNFHENRQTVLLVISKVVKKYGVEFAVVDVAALSTAVQMLIGNEQ